MWHQLQEGILDLVFPRQCVGCGRTGTFLCAPCKAAMPLAARPRCETCWGPLDSSGACRSCRFDAPRLDGIRAPFLFQGPVREAVHQLKYGGVTALAPMLAGFLASYLDAYPIPGGVLIPVPLHPARQRERGFNQSALLAKALGQKLGREVREDVLFRVRPTPPQVNTRSAEERRRNIEGAFSASRTAENRTVLLIDDVSTTGATLDACAVALRSAGVEHIWALVLAKES